MSVSTSRQHAVFPSSVERASAPRATLDGMDRRAIKTKYGRIRLCIIYLMGIAPSSEKSSEIGQPLRIFFVFAFDDVKESRLNIGRDWTATAVPDLAMIHFANRCHLGSRSGKERLICGIKLVAGKAFFDNMVTFVASKDHDRVAGDARKNGCQGRRFYLSVADDENVLAAAFRHITVGI